MKGDDQLALFLENIYQDLMYALHPYKYDLIILFKLFYSEIGM